MLLPASMAGLPTSGAWVCVGPPLSASGSSSGSSGLVGEPNLSPLKLENPWKFGPSTPIRLCPRLETTPYTSGSGWEGEAVKLPAMVVFSSRAVVPEPTDSPWPPVFPTIVTLVRSSSLPLTMIPPPSLVPEIVLLVTLTTADWAATAHRSLFVSALAMMLTFPPAALIAPPGAQIGVG